MTLTIVLAVVAVLLVLVTAGLLLHTRRLRRAGDSEPTARPPGLSARRTVDGLAQAAEPDTGPPVAVHRISDELAVVFGPQSEVATFGSPLEQFTPAVATGIATGNAALQALVAAGDSSGQLVRLTAESAAALNALGPITDSNGAVLGVVRDSGGQFAKVLRFTTIGGSSAISAVAAAGPAITALAIQLQLQQLSKQLEAVNRTVTLIQQHQTDQLVASVESDLAALAEAGKSLQATGVIDDIAWSRINQHVKSIGENSKLVRIKLGRAIDALERVRPEGTEPDAHNRVMKLRHIEVDQRPLQWFTLYFEAQRAVVTAEQLEIHRRITTNDPHLDINAKLSEQRIHTAIGDMHDAFARLQRAIDNAGGGDATSGLPWRNWWADKRHELKQRIEQLQTGISPRIEAVRTVHATLQRQPLAALEQGIKRN